MVPTLGAVVGFSAATAPTPAPAAIAPVSVAAPASGSAAHTAPRHAGSAGAGPTRTGGTPCAATVRACVSLGTHQAWLSDGAGHVTYGPVPARGGSRAAPTPVGTYRVQYKDRDHWSRQFDAPMPYSVFFYPGVATHADNPRTDSNGCVHLNRADAKRFYTALRPGEPIQVVR